MKAPRPSSAKILNHAQGLGAPTAADVRQRAQEIARIEGWDQPNEEHWRQAKIEMHGGHDFENGSHEYDMQLLVSGGELVSADPGRHTPNLRLDDDEHVVEELIAEGMDEALHEQMLQSRLAEDEEDDAE
jgi:hypothetical protein